MLPTCDPNGSKIATSFATPPTTYVYIANLRVESPFEMSNDVEFDKGVGKVCAWRGGVRLCGQSCSYELEGAMLAGHNICRMQQQSLSRLYV